MQAQRAAGKQVILCGDLNIAARGIDVPWRQCMLPMPALLDAPLLRREAGAATCDALREEFGQRLRLPMHELEKALERHGLADPSSSASAAAAPEAAHAAPEAAPAAPASAKARLEALLKQLWVELGQSNSSPRSLAWLARLLEPTDEGGAGGVGGGGAPLMVDAFAALRPRHRARATAWCQYTNKRYSNCGRRIDYFLVDAPLFAAHALAGGPLAEDEDEAGALRAATAGGRWLPAPFGGGGLPMVTMRVHDTQFCAPHTGIVYSPPHASDHVMVTLLLADDAIAPRPLPARAPPDEATRACTFRPPKTLASFFAKKPAPAADEGGEKRQKVG